MNSEELKALAKAGVFLTPKEAQSLAQRLVKSEAQLDEMLKQEPAGTVYVDCTTRGINYEFYPLTQVNNGTEVFTRPVPNDSEECLAALKLALPYMGFEAYEDDELIEGGYGAAGDIIYIRSLIKKLEGNNEKS